MELNRGDLLLLYRDMVRARAMDEKAREVYSAGRTEGRKPYSVAGEEAIGVGTCTFLRADDYVMLSHRCSGLVAKGVPIEKKFAETYGRRAGLAKGKGRSPYVERGVAGGSGSMGGCFPISVGLGMAARQAGKGQVVLCFFGDGTAQRGTLHESMNWASLMKLPILWVAENNLYYDVMPIGKALAAKHMVDLAAAYSMPGVIVDGQDVVAVYQAASPLIERARRGEGPSLLECKTYRFRLHGEQKDATKDFDPRDKRDPKELESWRARDPIRLYRARLLEQGVDVAVLDKIERDAFDEVRTAEERAWNSPYPEPHEAFEDMYAE